MAKDTFPDTEPVQFKQDKAHQRCSPRRPCDYFCPFDPTHALLATPAPTGEVLVDAMRPVRG